MKEIKSISKYKYLHTPFWWLILLYYPEAEQIKIVIVTFAYLLRMPFICPLPFTLESDEKQDVRGLHTTVARTKYGGYHHSEACFEFEYSNSKIVCMHNYR